MDRVDRGSVISSVSTSLDQAPVREEAPAIAVQALTKSVGAGIPALRGLSLSVGHGEFFGLLGPQGAGKTVTVRILATLVRPDAGQVRVLGYDVQTADQQVRKRIGYVAQRPALDERLTGWENVLLAARLHGLDKRGARQRADELLTALGVRDAAQHRVGLCAYGTRKMVALACGLAHYPPVLLLDDPASGLPVHERATIWQQLRAINRTEGATVFVATSSLEEAERLFQRVALIDGGRIVAVGTPAELKAQVAGAMVTIRLVDVARLAEAATLLERLPSVQVVRRHCERLELEAAGPGTLPLLLRYLEEHDLPVQELALCRSSLDEVFFRHTGRRITGIHMLPAAGPGLSRHR